jgi:NAD(P)-dependent dehydrogenase (short-subunit alcohol dehydrogenase family)
MRKKPMRRTVIVIGAAGGVGLEVARMLGGSHDLIGSVREEAQISPIQAEIPSASRIVRLDLSDDAQLRAGLDAILKGVSDLEAVIVCAAVCPNGPVETASIDDLREALEVNLVSHVSIFQKCMPALRRAKGRIIFVSSYSGKVGMPFTGSYVASKFALEGIADVMRREVSKWGVTVVLVEPGGLKTQMVTRQIARLKAATAALGEDERSLYGDRYRQFARLMASSYEDLTPPRDVAKTIRTALRAARPKTRYRVGADAKYLLSLNARRSDRAMDKVCLDVFDAADGGNAAP